MPGTCACTAVALPDSTKALDPQRTSAGLQVPFTPEFKGWTLLALDLAACLRHPSNSGTKEKRGGLTREEAFQSLRSIQVCANLSLRGIFTSDIRYSLDSIPRHLVISHVGQRTLPHFTIVSRCPSKSSLSLWSGSLRSFRDLERGTIGSHVLHQETVDTTSGGSNLAQLITEGTVRSPCTFTSPFFVYSIPHMSRQSRPQSTCMPGAQGHVRMTRCGGGKNREEHYLAGESRYWLPQTVTWCGSHTCQRMYRLQHHTSCLGPEALGRSH